MLPVYAVGSEKEAKTLVTLTCPTNYDGEYYARELLHEQTLENLEQFAERLDQAHRWFIQNGQCTCQKP